MWLSQTLSPSSAGKFMVCVWQWPSITLLCSCSCEDNFKLFQKLLAFICRHSLLDQECRKLTASSSLAKKSKLLSLASLQLFIDKDGRGEYSVILGAAPFRTELPYAVRSQLHPTQSCLHWLAVTLQDCSQGPFPALPGDPGGWSWRLLHARQMLHVWATVVSHWHLQFRDLLSARHQMAFIM